MLQVPAGAERILVEVPWPVWGLVCSTLAAATGKIAQSILQSKKHPLNGNAAILETIRSLDSRLAESAPMVARMATVLDATARELDARTPLIQGMVRALERLNDQFQAHDAKDQAVFAGVGARLDALQSTAERGAEAAERAAERRSGRPR